MKTGEPWLSACQPQQARLARHPRGVSEWPWSLPVCHTSLPDRAPVTCPPYRGGNWGSEGARTRSGGKGSLGGGNDARQAISGRPSPPEPQFPHLRDAGPDTTEFGDPVGSKPEGVPTGGDLLRGSGPALEPDAPHQRPHSGNHGRPAPRARTLGSPAASGDSAAAACGKCSRPGASQRPAGVEVALRLRDARRGTAVPPRRD